MCVNCDSTEPATNTGRGPLCEKCRVELYHTTRSIRPAVYVAAWLGFVAALMTFMAWATW